MATTQRITMTIPVKLVEDLNFISRHLGLSRSGLMSELLISNTEPMRQIIEMSLPSDCDDDSGDTPLKRDPETIRKYLSSVIDAVEQQKESLELVRDEYPAFKGSNNEH